MLMRRNRFVVLLVCCFAMLATSNAAHGTPMTTGGVKGVWHWPKGTTIKLYVPPDPDAQQNPDRRQALIDGISSWVQQQPLKSQDIRINVVTTDPGIDNAIKVEWVDPASIGGGKDGAAAAAPKNQNLEIGFARIQIERDVSGKDYAYNLGQHEGGHAFGLKDSPNTADVMYEKVMATGRKPFSQNDLKELSAAYTGSPDDTLVDVITDVMSVGAEFVYRYTTNWLSGGNLAVFQIDTNGAPITDVVPASGWQVDDFSLPSDVTQIILVPQDETFLSFIHASNNVYLDAEHPTFTFEFRSVVHPGLAEAFLNGRFLTVGVPEPPTLALLGTGLTLVFLLRRRIRCA